MTLVLTCLVLYLITYTACVFSFSSAHRSLAKYPFRASLFHSLLFGRHRDTINNMQAPSCAANSADIPAGESAHLKLQEIEVVKDENDSQSKESGDVVISEYVSMADNSTVLACVGGKTKLEYFSMHVFRSNYSMDSGIQYTEIVMDTGDAKMVKKYTALWESGKYMAQSKTFTNDWKTSKRGFIYLESFLTSNNAKMKCIVSESAAMVPLLKDFLGAQENTISGRPWTYYHYQPTCDKQTSMDILKDFCHWFRSGFPYYYSHCLHMECQERENNQYLGTVYPSIEERVDGSKAGRTELYLCGTCHQASRFPRFNSMSKVLETRRGRCGEYSVLLLQMLQALGYSARWVADRDDHVWAEVLLEGSWVHVDPCEAAVNEPFIYESWGKKPTYVLAYTVDSVCDVTHCYVKDAAVVQDRRIAENVTATEFNRLLLEAQAKLQQD